KHQRSNNVPISGPILQEKANDFARQLGKQTFNCSSSWIQRFRHRHNIVSGKISGEAADVPSGTKEEWLSQKWPVLCEGYKPEDIFNWLRSWDAELKVYQRKILLIVDNCPAHCKVDNLKFIKLVFLPPNVTSVLQPMDQGVIKSLKTHYRKLLVVHLLQSFEK
ncbi:GSCOCG00011289001-RA-CDS, partial [Cotesia congregata]